MAKLNQNSIYNPLIQVQTRVVITKHTPGPWMAEESYETLWIWDAHKNKIIVQASQEEELKDNIKDENRANARLIAAAPELLEVLVEILPFAEEIINSNHPTWKKAKSAIAKATGEKEVDL